MTLGELKTHGFKALGQGFAVAFVEDFIKIVGVLEAVVVVMVVFGKDLVFDQIKDDIAEIIRFLNTPMIQHRHGHGTVLLKQQGFDPC